MNILRITCVGAHVLEANVTNTTQQFPLIYNTNYYGPSAYKYQFGLYYSHFMKENIM